VSLVSAPSDRRFRRAHLKPARRRGRWRVRARSMAASAGLALLAACIAYIGRDVITRARVLQVNRIVVRGNQQLSSGEVTALLEGLRGENIIRTDLEIWRRRLLASPWVHDAALRRSLPASIEVVISERHPIGIARLGSDLYLVDDRGVVIDVYGPRHAGLDLPIIDGLSASQGHAGAGTDEARAELAARVILALVPSPELTARLSQVDVSDPHNVAITLSGDPAVLYVGEERFLARLEAYIELAAALRERVPDIDYVDLRFEDRIYARPATAVRASRWQTVPVSDVRPTPGQGPRR